MNETMLIVEDEVITAMSLESCLTAMEYNVIGSVSSGHDAIAETLSQQPDLVLMDVYLEGEIDGIEAAAKIHEQQDTPIVFLSALAGEDVVRRAMTANPYGYLIKPYREMQLKLSIETALNSARLKKQAQQDEEALRWSESIRKAITDAAKDCIICKDTDLRYIFVNPAMEKLLGGAGSTILGKTAEEAFGPSAAKVIDETDAPVLRGEDVDAVRTIVVNNEKITFHAVLTPLKDRDRVIGICGIIRLIEKQQIP